MRSKEKNSHARLGVQVYTAIFAQIFRDDSVPTKTVHDNYQVAGPLTNDFVSIVHRTRSVSSTKFGYKVYNLVA